MARKDHTLTFHLRRYRSSIKTEPFSVCCLFLAN
jgi:hypothetical protein